MSRATIKLAAGALALLSLTGSATSAFAIRNNYTREEAHELGDFMLYGYDATDPFGLPVDQPYRPYRRDGFGRTTYHVPPRLTPPGYDGID